jgi:hypothetical protein
MNPEGKGYYSELERARGAPLPNIERPEQLIRQWSDFPDPAGFTPCPELSALRMRDACEASVSDEGEWLTRDVPVSLCLRLQHHAPPDLLLNDVPTGAPFELTGLGQGPIRVSVPGCSVRATVRAKRGEVAVAPKLRAIHLDADKRILRAVHDFSFRYDPRTPPRRLRVSNLIEVTA